MAKTKFKGRRSHILRSLAVSTKVGLEVVGRRLLGRPTVRGWRFMFEYGTHFYREQFHHALSRDSLAEGRAYFDSVCTHLDDVSDVEVRTTGPGEPRGHWFIPPGAREAETLLYFHGGGYTFYLEVTRHFISLLAKTLGLRIFAPDYRLTPEHPHPAQRDDGLAAYNYVLACGVAPEQLVLAGDSAGGHLVLMTLVELKKAGLPQPAIALGLSPWTDTGRRGRSQFGNDAYDLVQGYMTLQFSEWLKGGQPLLDQDLSPMYQNFEDVAPIYLQAGGREVLVDMIRDFAAEVRRQGGHVRLDVWPDMNHEFQAYGRHVPESQEALERLRQAIEWGLGQRQDFAPGSMTEVDASARKTPT